MIVPDRGLRELLKGRRLSPNQQIILFFATPTPLAPVTCTAPLPRVAVLAA